MSKRYTPYIFAALLCLAVAIGWLLPHPGNSRLSTNSGQVRVNLPQYRFINPPLFSDSAKSNDRVMKNLVSSVSSLITDYKDKGLVESASIYFRDMNSGQWTGVNEDVLYTPSSMLKVVAMMAALKLAENDPSFLLEKLQYNKSAPGSKDYFDPKDGAKGGLYPIQDLIGLMIRYSDNDAFNALVADKRINAKFVEAYSLFQLPPEALEGNTTNFMSPKSFASIFRVLYNSSFFEWNLSEQILDLLSQTTFTEGLVGGVPTGTLVAHKFGENTDELHDCGLVYYPDHPYLLCIMTRGKDESKLESLLQGISKRAWEAATKLNPSK